MVGPVALEDLERLAAQQQVSGRQDVRHELARPRVAVAAERSGPTSEGEVLRSILLAPARRLDDPIQGDELLSHDLPHGQTILVVAESVCGGPWRALTMVARVLRRGEDQGTCVTCAGSA